MKPDADVLYCFNIFSMTHLYVMNLNWLAKMSQSANEEAWLETRPRPPTAAIRREQSAQWQRVNREGGTPVGELQVNREFGYNLTDRKRFIWESAVAELKVCEFWLFLNRFRVEVLNQNKTTERKSCGNTGGARDYCSISCHCALDGSCWTCFPPSTWRSSASHLVWDYTETGSGNDLKLAKNNYEFLISMPFKKLKDLPNIKIWRRTFHLFNKTLNSLDPQWDQL